MRRVFHAVLGAVSALIADAARPALALAQDASCDTGDRQVLSLEFRGNRAFTSGDLELRVATTESSWMQRHFGHLGTEHCLDEVEFPRDIARLKKFYEIKGYYTAKVDTLVQPLGKKGVRVVFLITEGEPIRIDSLRIDGLDSVPHRATIVRELGLAVGRPFDISQLQSDMDSIVARLRNSGYPRADIVKQYRTERDSLAAYVYITALPGPLARIGEIKVHSVPVDGEGAHQQISDNVVRRLIGTHSGDLYSDDRLVRAQRTLYQLGTYRHVDVMSDSLLSPDPRHAPGDSLIALLVELREDNTEQLETEVGWATLDCFHTRAVFTDKNFLGQARRLELTGQLSKIGWGAPLATEATRQLCYQPTLNQDHPFSDTTNYSIAVSLRQPGTFGAGWVPTYSIYRYRTSEFEAYVRTALIGGEVSAAKEVSTNGSVKLAYDLEFGRTQAQPALLCAVFNRCTQAEQDQISLVAKPLAIASAQYQLAHLDNPFNPSRGFEFRTEFRSSQRELGSASDLTFNKGTIDAAWFVPLGRGTVFATRLRGGVVLGPNSSASAGPQYIPPEERLYAGGANSVRGFQQNQLGSLLYIAQGYDSVVVNDSTRNFRSRNDTIPFRIVPTGGNALFVANFEYRVADIFFPGRLQYTFFVDGGDVWTRGVVGTGLGWSKMAWTPGVGIRVTTPVGPLQVNVAYNPYAQPTGAIYYDAAADPVTHKAPLYCVSPNNTIPVHIRSGVYVQDIVACPATFTPAQSATFFRRLTFTFSIGPQF